MTAFQNYLRLERGRTSELARILDRTPSAITQWHGLVPVHLVTRVSKITRIPKHKLRPDLPDLFPPPHRAKSPARSSSSGGA